MGWKNSNSRPFEAEYFASFSTKIYGLRLSPGQPTPPSPSSPSCLPSSDGTGIVVCQSAWNGPIKSADKKAIWRSLSTSVYLMVYLHIFSDIESWKTKKCRGRCFFLLCLRRYLYNYLLFKSSNGVVYGSSRPCATRQYFINDLEKKFHFTYLFTLLSSLCTVWSVYPVWNFVVIAILNSIVYTYRHRF